MRIAPLLLVPILIAGCAGPRGTAGAGPVDAGIQAATVWPLPRVVDPVPTVERPERAPWNPDLLVTVEVTRLCAPEPILRQANLLPEQIIQLTQTEVNRRLAAVAGWIAPTDQWRLSSSQGAPAITRQVSQQEFLADLERVPVGTAWDFSPILATYTTGPAVHLCPLALDDGRTFLRTGQLVSCSLESLTTLTIAPPGVEQDGVAYEPTLLVGQADVAGMTIDPGSALVVPLATRQERWTATARQLGTVQEKISAGPGAGSQTVFIISAGPRDRVAGDRLQDPVMGDLHARYYQIALRQQLNRPVTATKIDRPAVEVLGDLALAAGVPLELPPAVLVRRERLPWSDLTAPFHERFTWWLEQANLTAVYRDGVVVVSDLRLPDPPAGLAPGALGFGERHISLARAKVPAAVNP